MENVVYLLGAGFSAPLGLPVMRNFLSKAKDLYGRRPDKYAHFVEVFEAFNRLSPAKSYYTLDLLNIEDILSILDMEDHVHGTTYSERFAAFIRDVICAYTPRMIDPEIFRHPSGGHILSAKYSQQLFGDPRYPLAGYACFVAHLLNLNIVVEPGPHEGTALLKSRTGAHPEFSCSIVTLNYDRVVENCIDYIRTQFPPDNPSVLDLPIAKLHGCVTSRIIAPTWRKWAVGDLQPEWKKAYDLLSAANHLRILGYSLPTSDAYVRYLLAASVLRSDNLKSIDIICRDDEGRVEQAYADFITFPSRRFTTASLENYVRYDALSPKPDRNASKIRGKDGVKFVRLKKHHEEFMSRDKAPGATWRANP